MNMASSDSDKRRPSVSDINKMKAQELKESLKAAVSELKAYDQTEAEMEAAITGDVDGDGNSDGGDGIITTGVGTGIAGMLRLILQELRAMRAERQEFTELRQECQMLRDVVIQQQRFTEQLDAKDRERNLVITGVADCNEEFEGATTDDDKCNAVLSKISTEAVDVVYISRLGKQETGKKRPLLVRLASRETRDKILHNTKKLKGAGDAYKNIYVKKDMHPSVRREWKRLKDARAAEKVKPENQGCTIELDFRKRELRRNDVVIDRWTPTYFQ